MFGLHIVQPGLVEGHWGSTIGQLSALRMAADYDVEVVFAEADAANAYAQSVGFINRIHALLPTPSHQIVCDSRVADGRGSSLDPSARWCQN